ncbi:methyltransferase [Rhizobium sp. L1K21]|uniref:methyltransferase n=1 Tax=Rhizobium sp. L1K21 TaxID=2954933 RepID=UPI0020925220|nr:methyltransferase [Rhizobium sp. L1K21]MCO6187562.1 hypothetical protein [Rhizobium sp. L1K21]
MPVTSQGQDINMAGEGPPIRLLQQIAAYRTSQCLRAIVELGVPAYLQDGYVSGDDLAKAAGAHAPSLERVLNHLVNEGVFLTDDGGNYGLSAAGRALLPNRPFSLHPWINSELHPLYWRAWEKLPEQLKSGRPAFEIAHGKGLFSWLAEDVDAQARFDAEMRAASTAMSGIAVRHLDIPANAQVVDVGGGDGSLLAQILHHKPDATAVLHELPRSTAVLNPDFAAFVNEGRAQVIEGSFFDAIPEGGDVYLFSRVFHDFDDDAVAGILGNLHRATKGKERLFIIDMMLDAQKLKQPAASSQDIMMMVLLGGRERTPEAFADLLRLNGFEAVATTPTPSPLSILEFRRS